MYIYYVKCLSVYDYENYGDFNITFFVLGNDTTNLSIYDTSDSQTVYINDTVTFYANYTNNSIFIQNATCNISFSDGN